MPRVLFTRAARTDLSDALQWYETHAPHMVPHFRASLSAVVVRIEANSRQFPVASNQTRRAPLRRFHIS